MPLPREEQVDLALLHTFQQHVGWQSRLRVAESFAAAINRIVPPAAVAAPAADNARRLTEEGCVQLGQLLTAAQAAELRQYFRSRPCFNEHVAVPSDGRPRRIGEGAEQFHYGSYRLEDVLEAPYLLELANRPEIVGMAQAYLGCTPTLYSLNAWWSFAGQGKAQRAQDFHRDLDDYKFCTLFMYLTDVDAGTGPHVYIRRSHRPDLVAAIAAAANVRDADGHAVTVEDLHAPQQGEEWNRIHEAVFRGFLETIAGPAGSAFVADTAGLHMGIPPAAGPRLMFWARYGLYRNSMSIAVHPAPAERGLIGDRLPRDERTAYINRCIVGG